MKTMKLALLGGAAFAVMTAGAQADDLSALKAEIEGLNARVAQLEASPSVPDGYQLMTYNRADATVIPGNEVSSLGKNSPGKGYSDKVGLIGVLPTADAPATTTIEWSGYVYAIVANTNYSYNTYGDDDPGDTKTSVLGRAQLKVVGKTDTSVGEVGVRVQLRSQWAGVEGDRRFFANEYWGWWAMTPELTLGGGYTGSLGNIGYGMDGACNCWWTDWFSSSGSSYRNGNFDGSYDPGDTTQVRLSWASGPISAAIALEESDAAATFSRSAFGNGDLAVAGEVKFAGDAINGEVSGIWYDSTGLHDFDSEYHSSGWQVGGGLGFALGGIVNVSLAAATGLEPVRGNYWGVSGLLGFTLTDTVGAEVGANYKDWTDDGGDSALLEVLAGIYYNPVSQLTFGLEGEWANMPADVASSRDGTEGFEDNKPFVTFDVVSIFRF